MSSSISGLRYQEKNIGGTFKSSKVEYTWEFILDGTPQKIELIDSRWTGKKRLIRNGMEVLDKNKDGSFLKNFQIGNHIFTIITYGDKCELRVDNQSFTHLYNLEKNKNFFSGDNAPTSKVQVVKNISDNYSSSDKNNNNNFYKPNKSSNNNEQKNNLFNFSIKTDDSKQTGGLKKFKFGPGVKPTFDKNKNSNDNNNNNKNNNTQSNKQDLLGFGDDNQNNSNNQNNNNAFGFGNNNNNNDVFGFGNNNNNNQNQNNMFGFGNDNNQNQNNMFGFGNNSQNNQNNSNENTQQKSTNDQLLDVFSSGNQNNNNNQNNIQNNNNQENNGNKDFFSFDASNANNNNFFGQNNNNNDNNNNNNFGFFGSNQPDQTNSNNNSQFNNFGQPSNNNEGSNSQMNYPNIEEVNNPNQNNMNQNSGGMGFGFNFVPQDNNNFNNIQGFQSSAPGFNYEAYNNANKKEPQTNNDKLDNALKNLF